MSNIFLASDHHFGHSNILTFVDDKGNKVRTFDSVEAMDEYMVEKWNSVVSANSKVYHLGDVCFTKKALAILARLNGEKVLVKGNHDKLKLSDYLPYFKDVRGSHQFDGILLSHIPVHPSSLGRWPVNVHGHTHTNKVMREACAFGMKPATPDPRYYCVCVEQINYTPISLEELKKDAKFRLETYV